MRVLLFGGTGDLGSRCVQALLAHNHTLTIYVRNEAKLKSMFTPKLLDHLEAIVIGDALDSELIKKAIRDHNIEAIVTVAGNQVLPWKEFLLPKLAKVISGAAIVVGKERGRPLRAWICSGMGCLRIPGMEHDMDHCLPPFAGNQHRVTSNIVTAIPITDLRWSTICVVMMYHEDSKRKIYDLLEAPNTHNLLTQAGSPPSWHDTWWKKIPIFGRIINIGVVTLSNYWATYESVADLLAEDLEKQSDEWIGKKVGYKQKALKDD